MRVRTRLILGTISLVTAAGMIAGCGDAGSSGTDAPATDAGGGGCAPVAGDQLVVLEDDKKLQTVDNIIPAINADVAKPELVAALDKVSAALDTPKLIALNKAVDISRQTPQVAAREFATAANLTAGIAQGAGGEITVGAGNFSESETLAELYKIVLEAAGYQVTVQTIGNRELYEPALERGEIQVVPEYVGTMAEFLNKKVNGADAAPVASSDLAQTVAALTDLGGKSKLVFGAASPAADQNAFAVTKAFAEEHGLTTLSDMGAKCAGPATLLGGPAECPQRPFCQPGLEQTYGLKFGPFATYDVGAPTKNALTTGTISIGLVLSSDGALAAG